MGTCVKKTDVMLEKGEFPDRNVEGWKVEGANRRVTRKECKMLRE